MRLHNAPMIRLQAGEFVCELMPQLGGCVSRLALGNVPVLRPVPVGGLTSARQSGCYPLVPFSNRIAHATLSWEGTLHPLIQNNAPEPHAIHGVGWQRPWAVLDSDDRFVMMSYEHAADASWPFAFDCSQTMRISENSLEVTLAMTNQSRVAAPAGLGWHPYFIKRNTSQVSFEASGRWEMGEDKLPTSRTSSRGLGELCGTLDVDHCFDGWSGVAILRDDLLKVRISSTLRRLVVFTRPQRDSIAIEPVSHVNNAMSLVDAGADPLPLGVEILQPGETLSAQMTIDVERA